jgi:hypothetical protein
VLCNNALAAQTQCSTSSHSVTRVAGWALVAGGRKSTANRLGRRAINVKRLSEVRSCAGGDGEGAAGETRMQQQLAVVRYNGRAGGGWTTGRVGGGERTEGKEEIMDGRG